MPKLGKCCLLQCLQFQREEVITKLDFSNAALSDDFPQIWQHERTLEDLCLNSTRLASLPPQLFYCQGLRYLGLSNNNLESIPDAIGSLRQLQFLNFSRNFISNVPESMKNCKNLTHLDLSCNNLQRLPDAITGLISLQELFLNETYLEFLPANFGRLVNLRILELRLNSLVTLPKSMGRLSNLERMDIGGNEFTELPEVVGELSKLCELWVDYNQIRRISPNIGKLHDLQHFEASGNLIERLPDEVSNCCNVEVFSICTNNLRSLPHNFGMIKTLVTLKCEYCELVELPNSISNLEQLEEMVVSHNQLIKLPTTIGMLRKLRFLFADDNALQALPDELCSLRALTVLSVSRNKLTDLPQNIGHLTKLKVLNLVDNFLTSLPVSMLNMVNLSSLWLSDNQTQPLVPLQFADANTKNRLTCFMLPQNREKVDKSHTEAKVTNIVTPASPTRRICFANEAKATLKEKFPIDTDDLQNPYVSTISEMDLEPRLMRSPTPYPKELRMMSKYIRHDVSTQKLQEELPHNVKEARIVVNNLNYNCNTNFPFPVMNQSSNQNFGTDANCLYTNDIGNQETYVYSVESSDLSSYINTDVNKLLYTQMHQCFELDNIQQLPESKILPYTNENPISYSFYNEGNNTFTTPSDDSQIVVRSYAQKQQIMSPPPYHIARNYTKKTLQDLSNYDTMRNQKYFEQSQVNINDGDRENKTFLNCDEQNNLLSDDAVQPKSPKTVQQNVSQQDSFNQLEETRSLNSADISSPPTESAPPKLTTKKTSWLFGAHKNPTVKQITFKHESNVPEFLIGRMSNEEGIFIISVAPQSNASRLLFVHDKLLEVNGHDFTNMSLEQAKKIILTTTTGNLYNIMLSRK